MATLRNEPTQERSRKTLDSILAAADALFAEKGVANTTNSDIAERAGLSIGALYRFFPNQSALVAEYVERVRLRLEELGPIDAIPEEIKLADLEVIVDVMLSRWVEIQREFRGFTEVRLWRYPETGEPANAGTQERATVLIDELLTRFDVPFTPKHRATITRMIIASAWPVLGSVQALPRTQQKAMLSELSLMLCSYVRSAAASYE